MSEFFGVLAGFGLAYLTKVNTRLVRVTTHPRENAIFWHLFPRWRRIFSIMRFCQNFLGCFGWHTQLRLPLTHVRSLRVHVRSPCVHLKTSSDRNLFSRVKLHTSVNVVCVGIFRRLGWVGFWLTHLRLSRVHVRSPRVHVKTPFFWHLFPRWRRTLLSIRFVSEFFGVFWLGLSRVYVRSPRIHVRSPRIHLKTSSDNKMFPRLRRTFSILTFASEFFRALAGPWLGLALASLAELPCA